MKPQALKQPASLPILFFAEFIQRFSYWGIQSLLVLFLIHAFFFSHTKAYSTYGAFTALTFSTSIIGGLIADRFFGFKPSLILGILFSLTGNLLLAFSGNDALLVFIGLSFVCYGAGIFLPCNSNMLGTFYKKDDPRRDRGFTIFYIGTNAGGLSSPIIYGLIYQEFNWHTAFLISATGLALWLIIYLKAKNLLSTSRQEQPQALDGNILIKNIIYFIFSLAFILLIFTLLRNTLLVEYLLNSIGAIVLCAFIAYAFKKKEHRLNILLVILMIGIALIFFACELQTNSSMIIFAQNFVKRDYFGFTIPASTFASFEPAFVIVSSTFLLRAWKLLGKREPKELTKMIMGLSCEALAFIVLAFAAHSAIHSAQKISTAWMLFASLLLGAGEACIMPPLIASITHRVPSKVRGTFMGGLYLAIAFSGYLAGIIASFTTHVKKHQASTASIKDIIGFQHVYYQLFYLIMGIVIILSIAKITHLAFRKKPGVMN